ncbi:probable ATP-dependent RNA helicase DDX60 isoform X2 [Schistocerca piceifrons]|uniref:probable ATP-dependent RNA helicase DDX60 isoform X2 n=1 Tax=Schistocerca piceifrons TaxID=274613 RepID=UPI001F5F5E4E|nr:probable ATP-dependent RNA helicase DDX60 isoform X2 [Schistocerca piceifrons]
MEDDSGRHVALPLCSVDGSGNYMEDIDEKEKSPTPSDLSSDDEDSVWSNTSLSVSENEIYIGDDNDEDFYVVEAAANLTVEEQNKVDEASRIQEEKFFTAVTDTAEKILSCHVQYNDINDMIADRRSFLVDGDSLLINAVERSGLENAGGGQMLHCVYLCERLLQIFTRVSGTFEIVFSKMWDRILKDNHSIRLAKSVLKHHFRYNTKFFVHEVKAIWSEDFSQILMQLRPSFLLCDILPEECSSYFSEDSYRWVKLMSSANILYSVGQGLPCVDFRDISLDVSTIWAYVIDSVPTISEWLPVFSRMFMKITKDEDTVETLVQIPQDLFSVRRLLYIGSAVMYLTSNKDTDAVMLVKILLLKCAVLDVMPLKFRAFPPPLEVPKEASHFIAEIHKFMHLIMENVLTSDCCFNTVPDIWQGNLFLKLLVTLKNSALEYKCGLGSVMGEIYVNLTNILSAIWGSTLEPFPITLKSLKWTQEIKFKQNENSKLNAEAAALAQFNQLLPISCSLTREFCGEAVLNNLVRLQNHAAEMQSFISRNLDFEERHHWHSRKKLTDDFSRIPDNKPTVGNSVDQRYARKRVQKHQAQFARYMNIYGTNLEGRLIQRDVIVREPKLSNNTASVVKSKKHQKKKPEKPKKADIIRKQNNEAKRRQHEDDDKITFKKSSTIIKKFRMKFEFDEALQELELLKKKLKTELFELEMLLLQAEILHKKLRFYFEEKGAGSSDVVELYKNLFLLLRDILIGSECKYELSAENKKQIAYYLTSLNMPDISSEWNLPHVQNNAKMTIIDLRMSWAEFQLKHLGPYLIRTNQGEIDDELGFAPDDWQRMLIDVVRKRQSAVVVAPTSSGKTYASYYCMKSVLKEGYEGIVVYVSPTKALVNQVAATVYARFKNVTMRDGQSVYGIFTRDYRENALTCQILVTVPECLEILLMSPRMCSWVKRLRYIIFDEIHCLSGIAGGLSWETGLLLTRCPFLALSATIEQPEILQRWLQESMNFKKTRDMQDGCKQDDSHYMVSLITHSERHNDLKKHIYVHEQNSLVHMHPYACLVNKVVDTYNGIPTHLSLSAEETLSLFVTLQGIEQTHTDVGYLRPERFFRRNSQKLFITRSSVKEYEKELRELLGKWAHEFNDSFASVVSHLGHGAQNLVHNLPVKEVTSQLPSLIETLEKNKMFPAIVFLFNRNLIHKFLHKLNGYYDEKSQEVLNSSSDDDGRISTATQPKTIRKGKEVYLRERRTYSLGLLKGNASSMRNVGVVDSDDLKYIEMRLIRKGLRKDHPFVQGLRNGIGIHHAGLNSVQRGTVEMMFRMKVLNVVFATSTLALGIHMPCKTVVVATDSPFLTPLTYHQMSGRAGRRGFDVEGHVVFWGVKESKIQNLLTGKLPIMWGNFPMTVSLVLRLLLLVSMCDESVPENNADRESIQKEAISRALTFLNCNLIYQHFAELKQQMKHFFAFSTQLLMLQKLLDDNGRPQHLSSGIVTHLHYHEPGNLVFAYLLRSGLLHNICVTEKDGSISKETQLNVVLLMAHLFTHKRLHPAMLKNRFCNSVVKLKDLPTEVVEVIERYNNEVKFLFDHYFRCVAEDCSRTMGEDTVLPISELCIEPESSCMEEVKENELPHLLQELMVEYEPRVICSAFIALSGYSDNGLYSEKDTISNLRHQVFTDKKIVPLFEVNQSLNSYAWDFYNHGIQEAIIRDNLMRHGDDFNYLRDFMLVLLAVNTSLQDFDDIDENSAIIKTFGIIAETFREKFNKAYNIIRD